MAFSTRGISNIGIFDMVRTDIMKAQRDLARIQLQISTGRKLLSPHDDISGTSRVLRLQNIIEQNDTFRATIDQGKTKLESTDGVLGQMNSTIIEMQALIVDMADSGATAEMRTATAEVVNEQIHSLVALANTEVADQFLFSGFDSAQSPFERYGTEVVFHGDTNEISAQISQGQYLGITLDPTQAFGALTVEKKGTVDINPKLNFGQGSVDGHTVTTAGTTTTFTDSKLIGLTASDVIGREVWVSSGTNAGEHQTISAFNPATGLVTVDTAFNAAFDTTSVYSMSENRQGTRLADLNSGTGVTEGSIRITSSIYGTAPNNYRDVDMTGARTLSDVKERIEATSTNLTVTLNAGSNGIVVTDSGGSSITIASVNNGETAEDLGIAGTNAGGVITGSDLNTVVSERTLVADIVGSTTDPINPAGTAGQLGSIYVTNGSSRTGAIDLSSATTIEDVIDLINDAETAAGNSFHLYASINDDRDGVNIVSRVSGVEFSISNTTGDTTATELGLLTMTGSTTLASLRNGRGIDRAPGTDFVVNAGGTQYNVDISNSTTLSDVVTAINTATGGVVTASIDNIDGNSIQLTSAVNTFIQKGESNAAVQLGFTYGTSGTTLNSTDPAALKVNSIFTAAAGFHSALVNNNQTGVMLAGDEIDTAFDLLLQGRARVGGRLTRIDLTLNRLDTEEVMVRSDLSNNLDVDLTEAISDLQAQQLALQATYATSAQMLELSLVNFI